jgi:hypothetical protein
MKRTEGTIHQDVGIDRARDFLQEHELVREVDNKPVVTSKGEQFLNEHEEFAGQSASRAEGDR